MLVASLRTPAQIVPEVWVRHCHAFRISDRDPIPGRGGENAKRHRDAVITPRVDRAGQIPPPWPHTETVGQLVHLGSNRAQILDDGGDAITLLNPQFGGAADLQLDAGASGDTSKQW